MKTAVFDIETDGLNANKIHCLVASIDGEIRRTTSYDKMREFLTTFDVLIGHNIQRFDIPQLEKLLGIEVKARFVDTLALSWYLEPKRIRHGLEWWGEEFGIPKPVITDWESLTPEDYLHRCTEDVKINVKLWDKFWKHLLSIYGNDEEAFKLLDYLEFKMKCAVLQEKSGWKLDTDHATSNLSLLTNEVESKTTQLKAAMPMVDVVSKRSRPAKPFKKDGSVSSTGERWFALLKQRNLPQDFTGEIKEVVGEVEPKPSSHIQIKDWLYSLGWVPETFKYEREKVGKGMRKIPQINKQQGEGICESIKKLYNLEPSLALLDGLSVLSHRISILKGFLTNVDENGYIKAEIQGLTNTLRFKHKVAVNLPGVDKPYGDLIRACLVAPDGYELCGSDQAALEDRTKQHYMWEYDPDYVTEMTTPDFDPHLDIAKIANMLTSKQIEEYKAGDHTNKPIRHQAKTANYACTYGAQGPTVARQAGITVRAGELLVEAYWKRNWSIEAVAKSCTVKTVRGQKWLFNPVSELWYSLRHEKDRFSTLNQGTGTYCFDIWVREVISRRPQLTAQFHDEIILCVKKGNRPAVEKLLRDCVVVVNKRLKLNRELDIDVQFGNTYSEIH